MKKKNMCAYINVIIYNNVVWGLSQRDASFGWKKIISEMHGLALTDF